MKYYKVIDLQCCGFMSDTHNEPMTLSSLRSRFWSLDDCRTEKFSKFTRDYIEDMWEVRFEEDKEIQEFKCLDCNKRFAVNTKIYGKIEYGISDCPYCWSKNTEEIKSR